MKKCILLILCFLLISVAIFGADSGKIRMAVLPFSVNGKLDANVSDLLYDNFISAINENGKYSAVDRSSIDKSFSLLGIQKGVEFSSKNAIDVGAAIRAKVAVIGIISVLNNEYFVSVKGIDVDSGNELFREKDQVSSNGELLKLADTFAKSISKGSSSGSSVSNKSDSDKSVKKAKVSSDYSSDKEEYIKYMGLSRIMKSIGNGGVGGLVPSLVFVMTGAVMMGVGDYFLGGMASTYFNYMGFSAMSTGNIFYDLYCSGIILIATFVPLSIIFLAMVIVGYVLSSVFSKKAESVAMYMENRQNTFTQNNLLNNLSQSNPSIGIKISF